MIERAENKSNYTKISNELMLDETISDKARGLLVRLLTKPNDWNFNIDEVIGEAKEGRHAIRSAINELEAAGYLHKFVARRSGKIAWVEYMFYDRVTSRGDAKAMFERTYGKCGDTGYFKAGEVLS